MSQSQQLEAWMSSMPFQLREELSAFVRKQIADGIIKTERQRIQQPQLLVDLRTNQVVQAQKSMAADVLEFMTAMDQPPAPLSEYASTPSTTMALAHMLMFGDEKGFKQGEVNEMADAWQKFQDSRSLEHLVEFVDGAIDTIYVVLWTLNKLGVPADTCWKLVQDSNMAKLGPDGKPIKDAETGKIKKPEGWQPPDLFGLLSAAASQVTYVGGIAKHEKKSADRWICLACTSQREGFHFPDCTEFARSLNAID